MEKCLVKKYTYRYFNSDFAYHLQSSSQLDKAPISYLGQLCSTWNQVKQIDSFQPFCSTGTFLFNWYQLTSVRVTLKQCILALFHLFSNLTRVPWHSCQGCGSCSLGRPDLCTCANGGQCPPTPDNKCNFTSISQAIAMQYLFVVWVVILVGQLTKLMHLAGPS